MVADRTADLDVGVFVYNAAAAPEGWFLEMDDADDRWNATVNCLTPAALTRHLGRRMQELVGRGAIGLLVSSLAVLQGTKWFTTYGASKAYQLILAEGLWDEFRSYGVDVVGYAVGATVSTGFQGAAGGDAYAGATDDATGLTERGQAPDARRRGRLPAVRAPPPRPPPLLRRRRRGHRPRRRRSHGPRSSARWVRSARASPASSTSAVRGRRLSGADADEDRDHPRGGHVANRSRRHTAKRQRVGAAASPSVGNPNALTGASSQTCNGGPPEVGAAYGASISSPTTVVGQS